MNKYEGSSKRLTWAMALAIAAFVAGCGGGGGGSGGVAASATVLPGAAGTPGAAATNPTVISSTPANLATNVPTSTEPAAGAAAVGRQLTATFSEAMDPLTIASTPAGTLLTFTLKETMGGTNVGGTVAMSAGNTVATFSPTAAALTANTNYTATVTTAARNPLGTPMPKAVAWTFTTNAIALTGQAPVNLGTAGNFAILAKSGISKTGVTTVTGNIGVSPFAASFITGFTLAAPPTSSTTATEVVGLVYAADYDPPTPIALGVSVTNMQTAFTDAAGRTHGVGPNLDLGAGTVTGVAPLAPGVYTWGSNVTITGDLTLTGSATDVWIMQITGTLDLAAGKQIILAGGALAKNIFWQVSDTVTLLAGSHFEGVLLTQTNILLVNGATINGRLLSQTAVDLQAATVTQPAP